jgi:hypothetical protein
MKIFFWKGYHEYETMKALQGERLTVSATTYQYGDGEPLTSEELPHITAVVELLEETHEYLHKHDLSREIVYKDFTRGIEAGRASRQVELDYEAEDGYEQ